MKAYPTLRKYSELPAKFKIINNFLESTSIASWEYIYSKFKNEKDLSPADISHIKLRSKNEELKSLIRNCMNSDELPSDL